MPKTDVKKIESEDLKELSDEALDRAAGNGAMCDYPSSCAWGCASNIAS